MITFIRSRLPLTSDNSSLQTSSSQASFFTNLLLRYPPIVFSRLQEKNASLSCNIGLSMLTKRLFKVRSTEGSLWGKGNCDWPGGKVTSVHAG